MLLSCSPTLLAWNDFTLLALAQLAPILASAFFALFLILDKSLPMPLLVLLNFWFSAFNFLFSSTAAVAPAAMALNFVFLALA
jgi:hypothetical protein